MPKTEKRELVQGLRLTRREEEAQQAVTLCNKMQRTRAGLMGIEESGKDREGTGSRMGLLKGHHQDKDRREPHRDVPTDIPIAK